MDINLSFGGLSPSGELITEDLFGARFNGFKSLSRFQSLFNEDTYGLVIWPGGSLAERNVDSYGMEFDGLTANNNASVSNLYEIINYTVAENLDLALMLPTARYQNDYGQLHEDLSGFLRDLSGGKYGKLPNTVILEIGNEYYANLEGPTELDQALNYAQIVNEFYDVISEVQSEGVILPSELKLSVQLGRGPEASNVILNNLDDAAISGADLLSFHRFPYSIYGINESLSYVEDSLDAWHQRQLSLQANPSELFISAYNTASLSPLKAAERYLNQLSGNDYEQFANAIDSGAYDDGGFPAFDEYYSWAVTARDFGKDQATLLLEMFSEISQLDTAYAGTYGWDTDFLGRFNTVLSTGETIEHFGGQIQNEMAKYLVGTQSLNWNNANDYSSEQLPYTFGFSSTDRLVVFISAPDQVDDTDIVSLNLDELGELYSVFGIMHSSVGVSDTIYQASSTESANIRIAEYDAFSKIESNGIDISIENDILSFHFDNTEQYAQLVFARNIEENAALSNSVEVPSIILGDATNGKDIGQSDIINFFQLPEDNNSDLSVNSSLFGVNFLASSDANISNSESLSSLVGDLGATQLRFPGGAITETYFADTSFITGDWNSITTSDESGSDVIFLGLKDFVDFSAQNDFSIQLVLPTKNAFTQTAGQAIFSGTYGNRVDFRSDYLSNIFSYIHKAEIYANMKGVEIGGIEIGNEFWGSGQMTANEYGRLASTVTGFISKNFPDLNIFVQVTDSAGFYSPKNDQTVYLDETSSGDFVVLSVGDANDLDPSLLLNPYVIDGQGSAVVQTLSIANGFNSNSLTTSLVTGTIEHNYFNTNNQDIDGQRDFSLNFIPSTFEDAIGRTDLQTIVSEWSPRGGAESGDQPDFSSGLLYAHSTIDAFFELASNGVDVANFWPLTFANEFNDYRTLIDSSEQDLTFGGAAFKWMKESLIGTTPFADIDYTDKITLHGYTNETRDIYYLSDVSGNDRSVSLSRLAELSQSRPLENQLYFVDVSIMSSSNGASSDVNSDPVLDYISYITDDLASLEFSLKSFGIAEVQTQVFSVDTPFSLEYMLSESVASMPTTQPVETLYSNNFLLDYSTSNSPELSKLLVLNPEQGSNTTILLDDKGFSQGSVYTSENVSGIIIQGGEFSKFSGNSDANFIVLSSSETVIESNAGDDTITTSSGIDSISAGEGDDLIFSGNGQDRLIGGSGNDTMYGGMGDDFFEGGSGSDFQFSISGNNYFLDTGATGNGDELSVDDIQIGSFGDDTFLAGDGNDIIVGDFGSSMFFGDDYLDGGPGNDTLAGSGGSDTFIFGKNHGVDTIGRISSSSLEDMSSIGDATISKDFDPKFDVIDLTALGYRDFNDIRSDIFGSDNGVDIVTSDGIIAIVGVNIGDLSAENFLF